MFYFEKLMNLIWKSYSTKKQNILELPWIIINHSSKTYFYHFERCYRKHTKDFLPFPAAIGLIKRSYSHAIMILKHAEKKYYLLQSEIYHFTKHLILMTLLTAIHDNDDLTDSHVWYWWPYWQPFMILMTLLTAICDTDDLTYSHFYSSSIQLFEVKKP